MTTYSRSGQGAGTRQRFFAALSHQVTSIERIPAVADLARKNLAAIGITQICDVVVGGWNSWISCEAAI